MVNEICKFQKTCISTEAVEEFSESEMPKIDYDIDFSLFEKVSSLYKLIEILKRGI